MVVVEEIVKENLVWITKGIPKFNAEKKFQLGCQKNSKQVYARIHEEFSRDLRICRRNFRKGSQKNYLSNFHRNNQMIFQREITSEVPKEIADGVLKEIPMNKLKNKWILKNIHMNFLK